MQYKMDDLNIIKINIIDENTNDIDAGTQKWTVYRHC